ncbi:MFS transporter [soil metagenome]
MKTEEQQRREQISTRVVFFIAGFGMAAWAPLVPYAKARAGIDDGMLGLLLLCLGAGSMVAMPVAGAVAARWGCRVAIVGSTLIAAGALPLLATMSSFPLLAGALLLFGAGMGSLDVTMNMQAVMVERESGRTMMSGFHGLFSVGGFAGAAGITGLFALGASPWLAVLGVGLGMVVALALAGPHLLSYGSKSDGPAFALPHGIVLFLGTLCFILFLTEGAVLDWSAVFLVSVHGMKASLAGLGYTAFAVTMTVGRLTGDWFVRRFGPVRMVAFGGLCAAAGLLLATLVPSWEVALLGYALVGAGCSNIVPVLFSATGRQTVMPESVAIPAIATLGYAGILVGPAGIGLIAKVASLPVAFGMVAAMLVGVAFSARWLGEGGGRKESGGV